MWSSPSYFIRQKEDVNDFDASNLSVEHTKIQRIHYNNKSLNVVSENNSCLLLKTTQNTQLYSTEKWRLS
jgi:hypothetical protein